MTRISVSLEIDAEHANAAMAMSRIRVYLERLALEARRFDLDWQMHIDGQPVEQTRVRQHMIEAR